MEWCVTASPNSTLQHCLFMSTYLAGTRITVQNILELLWEGMSFQEIMVDYYPELDSQDIQACLQYAIALIAAEDIQFASAS